MTNKRTIEVFTAGCPCCDDVLEMVRDLACDDCEIVVHPLNGDSATKEALEKMEEYGVERVPAVAVDGTLASCCQSSGVDRDVLRRMGVGTPA